ncbi:MAG: hypothetical protein ACRDFB_01470 [Rhabdochlamydiaceae bacterium]
MKIRSTQIAFVSSFLGGVASYCIYEPNPTWKKAGLRGLQVTVFFIANAAIMKLIHVMGPGKGLSEEKLMKLDVCTFLGGGIILQVPMTMLVNCLADSPTKLGEGVTSFVLAIVVLEYLHSVAQNLRLLKTPGALT